MGRAALPCLWEMGNDRQQGRGRCQARPCLPCSEHPGAALPPGGTKNGPRHPEL